jgi:hypothetical protein
MAKKDSNTPESGISSNTGSFTKGLVRDFDENFDPESSWPYARNAANNSKEGDVGVLGNEPSNYLCGQAPNTVIGRVHLFNNYWVIFSTDDGINSEIGIYNESLCQYKTVVNQKCLNFRTLNLVTGVAKENFDCQWAVYFADGRNPDRYINLGNPDLWPDTMYIGNNYYENNVLWPGVQWVQDCPIFNDCTICTSTNVLDCEEIRINKLVNTPCVKLTASEGGGNLANGSYIAFVAYLENGQKYGDYSSPSNVQSIFDHDNGSGAITVTVSNLENKSFTEFSLVICATINGQTVARQIGIYSCSDAAVIVHLDSINDSLPTVPLELLPIRSPLYETSDSIFETGSYLLKIGPRTTFDFNYQPLANQIEAKWTIVRYPINYYKDGGSNTGYMRDEVYSFFIRWIYATGEKSKSYHIPGRIGTSKELSESIGIYPNGEQEFDFEKENSASVDPNFTSYTLEDGGLVIAEGKMGYWESSEKYPDRNPEVWNSSYDSRLSGTSQTTWDLCNKPIRHHKMPEDAIGNNADYSRTVTLIPGTDEPNRNPGYSGATHLQVVAVKFKNIKPPVYIDDDGVANVIPGIVGYEILRGSRTGNKSIIAKGIVNNMREYNDTDNTTGLYANYPYNPIVPPDPINGIDPTLSRTEVTGNGSNFNPITEEQVKKDFLTFHSPDTSFYKPFLSVKELRIYNELGNDNNVKGVIDPVPGHPKHKLVTNLASTTALLLGIAEAIFSMKGEEAWETKGFRANNIGLGQVLGNSLAPSVGGSGVGFLLGQNGQDLIELGTSTTNQTLAGSLTSLGGAGMFSGNNAMLYYLGQTVPANPVYVAAAALGGYQGPEKTKIHKEGLMSGLPLTVNLFATVPTLYTLATSAASKTLDLIYAFVKARSYVYRYSSHGFLHKNSAPPTSRRVYINDAAYLNEGFNMFGGYKINNINRFKTTILNTATGISNPTLHDDTGVSLSRNFSSNITETNDRGRTVYPSGEIVATISTTASCFYAGLKIRFRNQYGQLDQIRQISLPCSYMVNDNKPISNSEITVPSNASSNNTPGAYATTFKNTYSTGVLFGGDTYIGRYTEKNTFFYFYDWQYNQPDETPFNYRNKYLGLYPRYWADFSRYDIDGLIPSMLQSLNSPSNWDTPNNQVNLEQEAPGSQSLSQLTFMAIGGIFDGILNALSTLGIDLGNSNYDTGGGKFSYSIRRGYMYLFNSGVRDFYVESDINVDQRDWGELDEQKHYEVLSDLKTLFDTRIIKAGNYYKIDPSVSVSRLFYNVISWGNMQDRDYDPQVASLCYKYLPNRVIYSLPTVLESKKDGWRIFLPNNYRDFKSKVTAIRPIGKNGALMLFDRDSPVQIQGTETLESDMGTKITVGDGALFNKPLQALVNTDQSYEYGACQDKFSILNTPAGIYWISQSLGKIFTIGQGLEEISATGMRWWFSKFLPYRILVDFPNFEAIDNPVAGVGCQAVYDNDFLMIYFTKKDYELRKDLSSNINLTYIGGVDFILNGAGSSNGQKTTTSGRPTGTIIKLGDPNYFNDVSWTISYDPKTKAWVSFHDWHPTLMIPSNQNFISVKGNTFWRHNDRTDSFCNYYGDNYPFQVEYVVDSGQTVNTLKNIEYILESYVYDTDGIDRFQLLDFNFDELTIYNSEQVSGLLKLNMAPKEDPFARLAYPNVSGLSINIMYEKVEQKFRVNQFWDITANRGEYNTNIQRPIWLTGWDGYKRELNPANLDYSKSVFERKKFRHYYNNVLFTRKVSGNSKMLMKISNNKNLLSPR